MDKVIDKFIILIACLASILFTSFTTAFIIAFLAAIVIGFLGEVKAIPVRISEVAIGIYLVVALFIPEFVLFIPLVAYDYLRKPSWAFKLIWLLPFVLGMRFFPPTTYLFLVGVSAITVFLSQRTLTVEKELSSYKILRDELREESLALENKNRDLRERQDMDVHLATLDERGRIAREIHDNVGHLLTRSVLQIEAFQVMHAEDERVKAEFEQVGNTINEALDTVRDSVHNLHDDAFDLQRQMERIAKESTGLEINVDYIASDIPTDIGYCFIALFREAVSNTLKHSDATSLKATILEQPGFYRITIEDNGSNMASDQESSASMFATPNMPSVSTGIGLRTMEERVRSLNGIFRVDQGAGFRIIASIPKESREPYE